MSENNFQMYSAAVSDRGLSEKRPQNEDSFLEMKNLGLFAVADGVGGAQAGDVASQMAMEILGEAFINLQSNGDAEEMMRIAIERANNAIYQMSTDLPQLSTMATTIVALHLSGNIATIGHVGDSRLYRLDGKGSLYRETQDHSVVEEEVRAGRMTPAQAANHPSRNVISRALGAENTVEVDMKTIMFEPNTSFLICSDGITRHINDFEIRQHLLSSTDPAEICRKLKEICYERGAEDNLTAVVVKVVGAETDASSAAPQTALEDETTLATARPAVAAESAAAKTEADYEEIPTQNLEMPASMQTPPPTAEFSTQPENLDYSAGEEPFLTEEPNVTIPEPVPEPEEVPITMSFSATEPEQTAKSAPPPAVKTEKTFSARNGAEKSGNGFLGKLLLSFVMLIIGGILGIAAYYFLLAPIPQVEKPDLKSQSNDASQTSAENMRENADTKPSEVIARYENPASLPKDATDFYLLGRAYLLTRQYDKAKKTFIDARNMLSEVPASPKKTVLANDITMGLTIAEEKGAQTAFEKEMKFTNGAETNKQPNANAEMNPNTNSASNAATGMSSSDSR